MEWTKDPTGERYTLTLGDCRAEVWQTVRHGWGASVTCAGMSTATYGYATLQDGQAWCLLRLADLRQQGRCGRVQDGLE